MQIRNQEAVHETRRHSCIWRMMVCHVLQTLLPILQSSFFFMYSLCLWSLWRYFPHKTCRVLMLLHLVNLYNIFTYILQGRFLNGGNHSPLRSRKDVWQIADNKPLPQLILHEMIRCMIPYDAMRQQWTNSSPLVLHICVSESGQHWFR